MENIKLGDIAVFVRVVECKGFSAAARALRAPKSSISRQVARLEASLGLRLLHRTTRSLTLTEAGNTYYAQVSPALTQLAEAASAAADEREVPRGRLHITAPPDFGAEVLPDIVARFVASYPDVQVDVELQADAPNLVESGFDMALRVGQQPDSQLVIRKLQDVAFRLYAAPEYIAKAGIVLTCEDLANHQCVLFKARDGKMRWRLKAVSKDVEVVVRGPVATNDLSFARRAAIAGAGIVLLPELVGEPICAAGLLVPILSEYHSEGNAIYIVYPSAQHVPLKVRAFRDFLLDHFPVASS